MADDRPTFAPDDTPGKRKAARKGDWRAEGEAAAKARGKGGLVVLTLFLMLAVAGAIIGMLNWTDPPVDPVFVAVPVGEYADPAWPTNPWADRDAAVLADSFPARNGKPAATKTFAFQERDKFRELLAWVADGGTLDGAALDVSARPLVLFVTALAATDGAQLYLVPGNADPANPATWVPVDALLDALAQSKAKKKLLLLDLAHPTADPFVGPLKDDASARLHDLLAGREKAGKLPFPVLTSCGPGEFSLPADAPRCSGFAFYVAEGLRGAADGYLDGQEDTKKADQKVTVAELTKFVAARVARWARVAHDRRQTPRAYGYAEAHEFYVTEGARTPPPEAEKPADYPAALVGGWTLRDEQRAAGADKSRAVPVARLTAGLVAAERTWLGSGDDRRAELRLADATTEFRKRVPGSARPDPAADVYAEGARKAEPFRIAAARRGRPDVPEAAGIPLKDYLREYLAATTANPKLPLDKAEQQRLAWRKLVPDKLDAAGALMKVVAGWEAPTQADAAAWEAAFGHPEMPAGPYSETLLVSLLAGRNIPQKQRLGEYPSAGVAQLLFAEGQLSLATGQGAEGFALVAERVAKAEADRKAGQDALFAEGIQNVQRAAPLLKGAAAEFAKAADALARWQAASRAFAGGTAALLDTLSAELAGPRFDDWQAAADRVAELGQAMSRVRAAGRLDAADVPEKLVRDVQEAEKGLRARFAPEALDKLMAAPRPRRDQVEPIGQLAGAWALPPPRRKAVWDAVRADLARFHDDARKLDAADDENKDQTKNSAAAPEAGRVAERDLAVRRARASLALLKVAGAANLGELDRLVARLTADPDSAAAAQELATRLKLAWRSGLPADARAAQVGVPGRPDPAKDFAEEHARADVAAFEAALGRSLKADAPHRGLGEKAAEFYRLAENTLRTD